MRQVASHASKRLSDRHLKAAGAELRVSALLLWLYRSPGSLQAGLSVRVQQLMNDGLLAEVERLNGVLPFIERPPTEFTQGRNNEV